MPPKYIQHENGQFYAIDDQGNIIFTGEAASGDGVLTREVETGNMVNDPKTARTIYNVGNYDVDTEGYKITYDGRRRRRQAVNYLTRGNNVSKFEKYAYGKYGDGQFSEFFRDNGNLRRRAFRNDDFLQALSQDDYSTADLGSSAKYIAQNVTKIVNPQLRKKTQKGHWYDGKGSIWAITGVGQKYIPWCPTCNNYDAGGYYMKVPVWSKKSIDVKKWSGPNYDTTESDIQSRVEYDQVPEMTTEYASPVQLVNRSSVESRELNTSTPPKTTTTTRTAGTRSSGSRSTGLVSRRKTTTNTNTTTRPATTAQQRTTTWQELPDGTRVNVAVGDWTNTNT